MKTFLLIALLLLTSPSFAQHWAPINAQDHFHYKLGSSGIITNTIFADSITADGATNSYHLNRIIAACDSCVYLNSIYCDGYHCAYTRNQEQFMQRNITIESGGTITFSDPGLYVMYTAGAAGNTWDFDLLNGISATIDSITEILIFSEMDSVRFISLSNGRHIQQSKAHGILLFPDFESADDYTLCGISGPDIGERLPSVQEVFNFQPGDELMFSRHGSSAMEGCWDALIKYRYTARNETPDSIGYDYDIIAHSYTWNCISPESGVNAQNSFFQSSTSFTYRNSDLEAILNAAPCGPMASSAWVEGEINYQQGNFARANVYTYDDRYVIEYGPSSFLSYYSENFSFCQFYVTPEESTSTDFLISSHDGDVSFGNIYCAAEYSTYMEGLGIVTHVNTDNFEYFDQTDLIGAVLLGDTIGIVRSDSYILSVPEQTIAEVTIYPNPAQTLITVQASEMISLIEIYDLPGRKCLSEHVMKQSQALDISSLPDGVYIMQVHTGKDLVSKKIVISAFGK